MISDAISKYGFLLRMALALLCIKKQRICKTKYRSWKNWVRMDCRGCRGTAVFWNLVNLFPVCVMELRPHVSVLIRDRLCS